jgi:hypothetical protein
MKCFERVRRKTKILIEREKERERERGRIINTYDYATNKLSFGGNEAKYLHQNATNRNYHYNSLHAVACDPINKYVFT